MGQVTYERANTPRNMRARSPRLCYLYCMISLIQGNLPAVGVQVPLGHIYIALTYDFEHRAIRTRVKSQVTHMGVQVPPERSHRPIAACRAAKSRTSCGDGHSSSEPSEPLMSSGTGCGHADRYLRTTHSPAAA